MKALKYLVGMASATVLWTGTAHAALDIVYEIDLTGGPGAAPSYDFDINGTDNLRAEAFWRSYDEFIGPVQVSWDASGPGLITRNGPLGIGVFSGLDINPAADNYTVDEFIRFSIPTRDSDFEFRLVGVEFTRVDPDIEAQYVEPIRLCIFGGCITLVDGYTIPGYESDDDFSVWIDPDETPPDADVGTPSEVTDQNIKNGAGCGPDGTGALKCRVGLDGMLEAYVNGVGGIDPFDYYLDFDLLGSEFWFGGPFGEHNDDWKISQIYWEVTDAPEPATLSLLGLGLIGLGAAVRRRKAG